MNDHHKIYEITDLKQLYKMFHAGCGTFFIVNSAANRKFTLQFKHNNKLGKHNLFYSDIHVCFNDGLKFHLGRYNFKYQFFQLSDETMNYNYERLNLFVRSFKFVRDRITGNVGFPEENYRVFYDGTCCRCGKRLVNLESIKVGFGPDCESILSEEKVLQLGIPM